MGCLPRSRGFGREAVPAGAGTAGSARVPEAPAAGGTLAVTPRDGRPLEAAALRAHVMLLR